MEGGLEHAHMGNFFADILVKMNTLVNNPVTGTLGMDNRRIVTVYSKLWL